MLFHSRFLIYPPAPESASGISFPRERLRNIRKRTFFFPHHNENEKLNSFPVHIICFSTHSGHLFFFFFAHVCSLSNVVTFTLMEGIVLLRRSSHGRVVLLRPFCCTSVILNVRTLLILLISSYLSIHWSISSCTNQQQRFQAVYIFFLF